MILPCHASPLMTFHVVISIHITARASRVYIFSNAYHQSSALQIHTTRLTMNQLSQRIQGLPQELRDHVLFYTLLVEPNSVIIIDRDYRPPWQLSVNRASRRNIAPAYYHSSIFQLALRLDLHTHTSVTEWLMSLAPDHRVSVRRLRFHVDWHRLEEHLGIQRSSCSNLVVAQVVLKRWWENWVQDIPEGERNRNMVLCMPRWDNSAGEEWLTEAEYRKLLG